MYNKSQKDGCDRRAVHCDQVNYGTKMVREESVELHFNRARPIVSWGRDWVAV